MYMPAPHSLQLPNAGNGLPVMQSHAAKPSDLVCPRRVECQLSVSRRMRTTEAPSVHDRLKGQPDCLCTVLMS